MSGSSIGSIIGGILGFALAPFTGGASLLVTSALMAAGRLVGGLLDPPAPQQLTGPRLADLSQQTATYGAFIPRIYGKIAVMGNVFWIEHNKLKEVATTQTQGGKAGPPEVNSTTYKYYGTFAVGLCEGIDPALYTPGNELLLTRIWIGEKLFYNRSSADDETVLTSIDRETKFKFYSGTETQMPEPRMEADLGIANTPAYRGLAYIVIYDLDVGAYGNTIAGVQIKAELHISHFVSDSSFKSTTSETNLRGADIYNDRAYMVDQSAKLLKVYDIKDKSSPVFLNSTSILFGALDIKIRDHYLYVACQLSTKVNVYDIAAPVPVLTSQITITSPYSINFYGGYVFISIVNGGVKIYNEDATSPSLISSIVITVGCYYVTVIGNYAYMAVNGPSRLLIYDISNITSPLFKGEVATGSPSIPVCVKVSGNYAYVSDNAAIYVIDISDKTAPSIVNTLAINAYVFDLDDNKLFVPPGTNSNTFKVLDITNPLSIVSQSIGSNQNNTLYCTARDGLAIVTSNSNFRLFSYLARPAEITATLSDIVNAECLHSNLLDASDLDVSLLTQSVRGYRISSVGSIRGGVEPLQAAWPFDVIQDGNKIKYVPRGGSNVATITYDKLDARGDGAAPGIQISNSREMESQLPAKVSIKYMDINRAYNTGEQYYERINTDAVNHADLEMPIVFNAQEAAGKAQTLAYLYWLERYDISFKLPPEYLQLQPSDVITITTPDASYNLRLKQINYTQDGRLECQAKYNHAALYSPSATGEEGVPPDDTLSPPGTTTYELLDIPCLQDIYNVSGFPVAMTGAKKGWPGGVLARSDDGGASYATVGAVAAPGTIMGKSTNTIGSHNGLLLDKASILNVTLTRGSLSSVSELQMFNGANHFAYGIDGRWEIIAAQNCVLQGDGSYKLSDFMRGRFGTEIYTGTHAVNDNVIYLASAAMLFQTLNSSAIGLTRHYKGVNFQSTLDTVSARAFIYNGVNLECLSPVYLNGNRHPTTNDWTLDWIRRGRINNEWKDLIDVPVGETSEAYEIDIYSSSGFSTVLRTLSGLTSSTATYTSAQQVTDFGSNQATLHVKVYQLSSNVGRGYPLTQSITR